MHLFIDSLVHPHLQSMAYLCSGMDSFSQGLCLDCKKGRCNTLGYHTRQAGQSKKSKQLFLVTRDQAPFKGECGTRSLRATWRPRSSPKPFPAMASGSMSVFLKLHRPRTVILTRPQFSQDCGHHAARC